MQSYSHSIRPSALSLSLFLLLPLYTPHISSFEMDKSVIYMVSTLRLFHIWWKLQFYRKSSCDIIIRFYSSYHHSYTRIYRAFIRWKLDKIISVHIRGGEMKLKCQFLIGSQSHQHTENEWKLTKAMPNALKIQEAFYEIITMVKFDIDCLQTWMAHTILPDELCGWKREVD